MANKTDQVIGWHGVMLRVFQDWSVVGFGGDQRSGSMRIDSGGDSETMSGLEVRWSAAKGRQTADSLEARIKPLLQGVKKKNLKSGAAGSTIVRPMSDQMHCGRPVTLDFRWSAANAGHGRIFYCEECGRTVVAQVYGLPGNDFNRLSKIVLDTIECHSPDRQWTTWGLYGLLTQVPSDFELVQQQLLNVYLQLKFQRRNGVEQLMIEQWSLANVQLKGAYLDEWYDLKSVGWTDGVMAEKAESDANGHPSLAIAGCKSDVVPMLIETVKQYARLRMPALHYCGQLWECPESNKAYMIQSFTRAPEAALTQACAGRTVCHVVSN